MAKRPSTHRKKPVGPPAIAPTQLSVTEVSTKAERLESSGDRQGAISLYRSWLKNTKGSGAWIVWFNLGVLLRAEGDINNSIEAYKQSLKENPSSVHARINLGTALEVVGQIDEAMAQWRDGLLQLDREEKPSPELLCAVLNNLGRRLEVAQKYTEAEEMLNRSLLLNPKQDAVLYHRIYLRQKQCAWPIYDPIPGISEHDQRSATSAVAMLSITDDPAIQLSTALSQIPGKAQRTLPPLANATGYKHDRIRVGYLSSNFGMHAVSILTAELFEVHDRERFEIWGFCWSPEDNTEMRERVIRAMDHFVRIKDISDEEAALAIRAAEIDILIDLQGLTSGCRPAILAHRPAPIQITYLGFPGTTGLPGVDYVIADRYIIPEGSRQFFTEQPIYLPDCFQVNDRKRVSTAPKSRQEYGLPSDAFVFCAFNNNIKFTPEFFSAWMRILQQTTNTVLWLLADNELAKENLGRCADQHGVARKRLIFAPRVSVADYLGRFAAADLFLDLFPFNGGTTAADALWMGLPIVTCSGRSFASRMAGSLLHAIGLPELITTTPDDYVELAVNLANDADRVRRLRERIIRNKDTHPLFDTPQLVRNLEAALLDLSKQGTAPRKGPQDDCSTEASHSSASLTIDQPIDLVIYTVLIGDKEPLNNPLRLVPAGARSDLRIQYICLTDNPKHQSPTWTMQMVEHPLLPKEKLSRLPKTQPNLFFPSAKFSLYIDNTVVFKRLPQSSDIRGATFRAFRHPWRTNPTDEADIVAKNGLDRPDVIAEQINTYSDLKVLDDFEALTAGTVLLRAHHHVDVVRFGEYWWQQVLIYSKRDQLSIDVAARAAKCSIEYFAGDKRNNDLFHWPALPTQHRILSSFDDKLYAWEHRDDPEAKENPRRHYLVSECTDSRYTRQYSWLDYLCNVTASSLGNLTPPRRGIASILDRQITDCPNEVKNVLIAGVQGNHQAAVDPQELIQAKVALTRYFRFTTQADVTLALVSQSELKDRTAFRGANGVGQFDIVVVTGVPSDLSTHILEKFVSLIPSAGRILIQFNESLTMAQLVVINHSVESIGHIEIFHSQPSGSPLPLPNSVISFVAVAH